MGDGRIQMGVIGRPHGVRGLLHVHSYAEDPASLAAFSPLFDAAGRRFGLRWVAVGVAEVSELVELDGERLQLDPSPALATPPPYRRPMDRTVPTFDQSGPTERVPLGVLAGARSGDKGGSCTLGVYTRTDLAFRWLAGYLTAERLAELLPEARGLDVSVQLLPNVRAVLFQIPGLLGQGVAAGTRFDPQAKGVGEWLRSRYVDAPISLLSDPAAARPAM